MEKIFRRFVRERQYVGNVSAATVAAYEYAWRAFAPALAGKSRIEKHDVIDRIGALRERGLSAVSINTYVRSLNAFARWLHEEGHAERIVTIPRLREPQRVMQAFTPQHVRRLIAYRPRTDAERQIHTLALLVLDTGLRIDEALSLDREADVDYDSLLITVRDGKGGKGRVVPMSLALRKALFRHCKALTPAHGSRLFFAGDGTKIEQRNALRVLKRVCADVNITGVRCSWHTLRHTFATSYLRAGGDVFRLQRILGHTKLEMTRRYVHVSTSDLSAVHDRLSPLSAGG